LLHDVRAEPLAHPELLPDQVVRLVPEGPDLVRRPRLAGADERPRLPDAVEPEQRAERGELEPAHDELAEVVGRRVAVPEAADVGRPPRDPRDPHVHAGRDSSSTSLSPLSRSPSWKPRACSRG